MGILDDAIREHLDLKRKHGARDAELREIEDEAFGSADRPDAFTAAELFAEGGSGAAGAPPGIVAEPEGGSEEPTRLVEPAGLGDLPSSEPPDDPLSPPEGLRQTPGQEDIPEEIPGQENLLDQDAPDRPSVDEPLADLPEPPAPSESLEELIAEEEPFPEDTAAPTPPPETAERPGGASEVEPPEPAPGAPDPEPEETSGQAESSVPDPPPPPPESGPEPPGRARGRVDVPTQEHPPPGDTGDLPPVASEAELRPQPLDQVDLSAPSDEMPAADAEGEAGGGALYDFETDEEPLGSAGEPSLEDDFDALGPAEEEAPYLEEEEPYSEEPVSAPFEEPGTAVRPAIEDEEGLDGGSSEAEARNEEEDSEDLWFEKGPPKDFDFDD